MSKEGKDLSEVFAGERDQHQAVIDEIRRGRSIARITAGKEFNQYLARIGELSFLLGASIVPITFFSSYKPHRPTFVFTSVAVLLFNGTLQLFRQKHRLEREVDDSGNIAYESELAATKIKNVLNKLVWDPDNESYQEEYKTKSKEVIAELTSQDEKPNKVSYWSDVNTGLFVLGAYLLAIEIWPWDRNSYYLSLTLITIVLLAITLISSLVSNKSIAKHKKVAGDLKAERDAYQDWHNENVLK